MAHTTLSRIKYINPCVSSWSLLLQSLGKTVPDDEPLEFKTILEILGIKDAVWCLETLNYKEQCLFLADMIEMCLEGKGNLLQEAPKARDVERSLRQYHKGQLRLIDLRNYTYHPSDSNVSNLLHACNTVCLAAFCSHSTYISPHRDN